MHHPYSPEAARTHLEEMHERANAHRRAARLLAARKWERRAAHAARRARLARNAVW
jgi:hypothetical protein